MSTLPNSTWKIDSDDNMWYVIGYENNVPIICIPSNTNMIDEKQIIRSHKLSENVKFKVTKKPPFIGW